MEVASMLKSKDALVPFRNFNFGKKWSLTAMEKATALPLQAGCIPNSPMSMLDASNWLLLATVSATGGGRMPSLLVFLITKKEECLGNLLPKQETL
jgi:hypothetical protein